MLNDPAAGGGGAGDHRDRRGSAATQPDAAGAALTKALAAVTDPIPGIRNGGAEKNLESVRLRNVKWQAACPYEQQARIILSCSIFPLRRTPIQLRSTGKTCRPAQSSRAAV